MITSFSKNPKWHVLNLALIVYEILIIAEGRTPFGVKTTIAEEIEFHSDLLYSGREGPFQTFNFSIPFLNWSFPNSHSKRAERSREA